MKKLNVTAVIILTIVLCSALFAGCTSNNDSDIEKATTSEPTKEAVTTEETVVTEEPIEDVTLTMWHNFGADTETPFFADTIVTTFEEANPNIHIEIVAQGNDQYRELLITNIAAGTTPDIARIDGTHMAGFAKEEALAALDGLSDFELVQSTLFEGCMSSGIYKGNYYALPLGTNCKTAVMDMDVMKDLGFDSPPATMEEIIDAAKSMKSGEYMINFSSCGAWDILPYFWLFGGTLSDDGFTTTTGYVNGEASVNAVSKLVELHDEQVLTIKEIDGSVDAWDGIRENVYSMFIEGPWFFKYVPEYVDMNIVPAIIPTYNGNTASIIGGESIVMFDTCENKEAAFTFMKYLVNEDTQLEMAKGMGAIPVNTTAAENEYIQDNEVLKVYVDQLYTAKARIPSPASSSIEEAIKDQFSMIFNHEVEVQAGLDELAIILNEILVEQ